MEIEQIYKKYVKKTSIKDQLKLISIISQNLSSESLGQEKRVYSLLELEGLGKEIWDKINAQDYINDLRDEWNS